MLNSDLPLDVLGPHDSCPREYELINFLAGIRLDYGALRELRRHRMLTLFAEPMTMHYGYQIPELIAQRSEWQDRYETALHHVYQDWVFTESPYLVTHGHLQQCLVQFSLREFHHIAKLRLAEQAHPHIRQPIAQLRESNLWIANSYQIWGCAGLPTFSFRYSY